jgi:mono/diheme cytochrome c family protein
MSHMPRAALLFLLAALTLTAADTQGIEFFEKQVRPLLAQHCYACHGPSQQFSSLRLDSREGMLKGGNRGPAVVPSDPAASLVTKAIHYNGLKMPPGGKLNEQQIAAIEKWIAIGAPWPEEGAKAARTGNPGMYEKLMREHWAFQPVREPAVPPAANSNWSSQPIDRFILATLEKNGLKPSPPAPREALIRRLALVLTGLPPTPLEVDLFVRDQFPGAWERLVDRLLKSPHFGEQWARHWMDVMRFAETYGNDWNYEINGAYRYRDYLIRAFNEDVPYDQLIREHFAGDLLPRPRMNPENGINESIIGTAFFRLGELGHDDCIRFRQIRTDVVDNQIDTIGKAFQGLTIACARCHDHKLDPIPTADYYALYGVLTSSRMVTHTADLPPVNASIKQNLAQRKPLIRAELAKAWRGEIALMPRYLMAAYRAVNKLPTQPEDLTELSLDRIEAWVKVLDKPKSTLEDPLYPFLHSSPQIEARYRSEARARVEFNKVNFRPFGDLTRDGFGGWHAEGNAVDGPSPSGEFAIAAEGPEAITGIYPAGFYTHSLSERLNAAMRSPLVPKDKKFISIQVMGGHLGARRAILDNCMLSEDYQTLDQPSPRWIKIPNRDDQPDLPFYLELVTKQDNPRIPDRPGRLKATPEEVASPFSYFGITRASPTATARC